MKKMLFLTKRQHEVFTYIKNYYKKHGFFPTFREIADNDDMSIPTVQGYIVQLEIKGALKKIKNKSRAYIIL